MKRSWRFFPALWTAKLTTAVLRLFHRNATHLPGLVALKLCPTFLGDIGKPKTIIAVTGTNGKTTVCNLLDDILPDCGVQPLNNRTGSNVNGGILTTFLNAATLTGRVKEEMAVIEVDERSALFVFKYMQPDYLVVTNLFRDSFKRNAHSEFISDILNQAIPQKTKLIVNADDLIGSRLAPNNDRITFGIAHREGDWEVRQNIVCDMVACPYCNTVLEYDFVRYNHIGRAHCPKCDFASPPVQYEIIAVDEEAAKLTVCTPHGEEQYRMIGDNITDWYNTLAAVTILRVLGFDEQTIEQSLQKQQIVKSRFERIDIGDKAITMLLAKGQNPIACSRAFDYIRRTEGKKAVILLIEDYYDAKHTSENVAWLYDADFEFLNDPSVEQIVIAGVRAADFRVRLLLAGVDDSRIVCMREEVATADAVDFERVDNAFVLFDVYTTMFADATRERLETRLNGQNEEVSQ